jgi:saccharopine dehydrogenase-like NADP-dependent oxidoreductase
MFINVPALTGRELIYIPKVGVLEAAVTSGGVSTSAHHLLTDFSYKTLRYPGHWDYIIKHVLTQPDPANVLEMITEKVSEKNKDLVVLLFELEFESGEKERIGFRWEYDTKKNISAMSKATGYITGAVATMVNEGLVKTGVSRMDELCLDTIIARVKNVDSEGSFLPISF